MKIYEKCFPRENCLPEKCVAPDKNVSPKKCASPRNYLYNSNDWQKTIINPKIKYLLTCRYSSLIKIRIDK